MRRLTFGEFTLHPESLELLKDGGVVPLQDKPFELLKALLEHPGQVVSRESLKARLWPDNTFVDFDNNLNAAVKKLRDALGDSAERPRFIQTVPRRGYCFTGAIAITPEAPSIKHRSRLVTLAAAFVTLAIGAAVLVAYLLRPAPRARLVVLPFTHVGSSAEDDALAEGISEEVSTHLGRLAPEKLGVIAHSSTLAASSPRDLDVDYFLEGAIRGDAESDAVRVTIRLVERDDETQKWSEVFELRRDEAFRVPERVAVGVARALAIDLLQSENAVLARAGTTNGDAYLAYLRGRRSLRTFSVEGFRDAEEAFREALVLDGDYALALVGLAETSRAQGRAEEARSAAERAIAIEPRLAEAHAALGQTKLYLDSDLEGASNAFARALELHPDLSEAHHGYAAVLAASGRIDEAITEVERGLELDPFSAPLRGDLGFYYLAARRFPRAIDECRALVETSPGWARDCLVQAYAATGREKEALVLLQSSFPSAPARVAPTLTELRRERLERAIESTPPEQLCPLKIAGEYGAIGDRERALAWLERAVEAHVPGLVFINVDPAFESVRDDPRFARSASKVGIEPVRARGHNPDRLD